MTWIKGKQSTLTQTYIAIITINIRKYQFYFIKLVPPLEGTGAAGPSMSSKGKVGAGFNTSWWFQPRWDMVKLEIFPKWVKIKNIWVATTQNSCWTATNKQRNIIEEPPTKRFMKHLHFFWVQKIMEDNGMPRPSKVWVSNVSLQKGLLFFFFGALSFHTC